MSFQSNGLPAAILAGALLLLLLAAGGWDVYLTYAGRTGDTVSAIVGRWSMTFPVLPLLVGLLLGHLFWPRSPPTAGAGANRPAVVWKEDH